MHDYDGVLTQLGMLNPYIGIAQGVFGLIILADLGRSWREYNWYQIVSRILGALLIFSLGADRFCGAQIARLIVEDMPLGVWGQAGVVSRYASGISCWAFVIFVIGAYWQRKV